MYTRTRPIIFSLMPPTFPAFEPLTLQDRNTIEAATNAFLPYSDFNFTSLYSWNTAEAVAYSFHQGNLVIKFTDYLTGKQFYSFIGKQNVNETAEQLLLQSKKEGLDLCIKLLAQETADEINRDVFQVSEDPDNFDYILSVEQLKAFAGTKFLKHRNKVNKFTKAYQTETKLLDLADLSVQQNLQQLFLKWEEWKQLPAEETKNELKAVNRLFHLEPKEKMVAIGIFLQDELLGFSLSELLPDNYGMLHFEKATPAGFTGIYQYLKQETARVLASRGCQLLNCQQDLGIPGLRTHKMGLSPVAFLKKYRVSIS